QVCGANIELGGLRVKRLPALSQLARRPVDLRCFALEALRLAVEALLGDFESFGLGRELALGAPQLLGKAADFGFAGEAGFLEYLGRVLVRLPARLVKCGPSSLGV